MYLDHYGFDREPFNITPDSSFLFTSKRHSEALANLLYGIEQRKGFIALTGNIGCGKTTICRVLLKKLDRDSVRLALILNPQLNDLELLQAINAEYGIDHSSTSKRELLQILNEFLLEEYAKDHNCVLVIDESQRLTPDALEQVRLISNLETETTKLIQIALVGQPELDDLLHLPELEQLNQRVTVRYHIEPLDFDEMVEYIDHRVAVANPTHTVHWDKKGLKQIFRHSGGVPRKINVVCDRALLIAFVDGSLKIEEQHIRKAIEEVAGTRNRVSRPSVSSAPKSASHPVASNAKSQVTDDAQPDVDLLAQKSKSQKTVIFILLMVIVGFVLAQIFPKLPDETNQAEVVAPLRPTPLPTPFPTKTPEAEPIQENVPDTEIASTSTPKPAPVTTPDLVPSVTPVPSPTETPEPTQEPTPVPTETPVPTPIPLIPEITPTPTPTPEPTPSPTPEPTPSPTPTPTPTPSPTPEQNLPDWTYDSQGVLRVNDPAGTYVASVLTWVNLTMEYPLPETELKRLKNSSPEVIGKLELTNGSPPLFLQTAEFPPILEMLENTKTPVLIQSANSATVVSPWVVLTELKSDTVVVMDPVRGRSEFPRSILEDHLASIVAPYSDQAQWTGLSVGDQGDEVFALQTLLKKSGHLSDSPNGVFDNPTLNALNQFQKKAGIESTTSIDSTTARYLFEDSQ